MSIPNIFISATTSDLKTVREEIKSTLLSIDAHPIEQQHFSTDYRSVRQLLESKIEKCDGVIHFVGQRYGSEPKEREQGEARRSYCQFEYDTARRLNKRIYLFIAAKDFPFDDCDTEEDAEIQALQDAHRKDVSAGDQVYHTISNHQQLREAILRLRPDVEEMSGQSGGIQWRPFDGKRSIWIALGAATCIALAIFVWSSFGAARVNLGGDAYGPIIGGDVKGDLVINQGDSLAVKAQKLKRAKQAIAVDVIHNLEAIDAHLHFVHQELSAADFETAFDQKISDFRAKNTPAIVTVAAEGYDRLMAQQKEASLRNAFNSRPLSREVPQAAVEVLIQTNADHQLVRTFFSQIVEVFDAGESVLNALSARANEEIGSTDDDLLQYHHEKTNIMVDRLVNRSQIAHLAGLRALRNFGADMPDLPNRLANLKHLEPKRIVDEPTLLALEIKVRDEAAEIHERLKATVVEIRRLRDQALRDAQEDVSRLNTIQSTDSWQEVIGKAIALRELGRTRDAVAAFEKYGELFSATDPTAERYSKLAKEFTVQMQQLGVSGGLYLFEVLPDGVAAKYGLQAGDILVDYDGTQLLSAQDINEVMQGSTSDVRYRITLFRFDEKNGRFERQVITIEGGTLGAGFMRI